MTQKRLKVIAGLFLVLVILSLFGASLTFARYVHEEKDDGIFGGGIDYVVAEQVTVRTPEDFITAIENGYTNVQIASDAVNPFMVVTGVTDVYTDLVLDLNGHTLQRVSRDPMLNIRPGVLLTIVDSSLGKTGTMYNPVGSVLHSEGGVLTTMSGNFESGPRKNEYYEAPSSQTPSARIVGEGVAHRGTFGADVANVTVYTKNTEGTAYNQMSQPMAMPSIQPNVLMQENASTVLDLNGNIYLEKSPFATGQYGDLLTDDTFLYFSLDDRKVGQVVCNSGSADFWYAYSVDESIVDGKPSYQPNPQGQHTVYVFGFHNAKAMAQPTTEGTATTYAAIRANAGNVYLRGGNYYSHFGVNTAYAVYADGGYVVVEGNPSFTAIEEGVCVRCNYDSISSVEYLNVRSGTFNAVEGNMILVEGGRVAITGGTFHSNRVNQGENTPNLSVIHVINGTIDSSAAASSGVAFNLAGNNIAAVHTEGDESVTNISNATFTFALTDPLKRETYSGVKGIHAEGGTVNVTNCTFTIPNDNSWGILVSDTEDVPQTGGTTRIARTGRVKVTGSTFTMTGNGSGTANGSGNEMGRVYGISLTASSIDSSIEVTDTVFAMTGNYVTGISSTAANNTSTITVNGGVFSMTGDDSVTGLYMENGTVTLDHTPVTKAGADGSTGETAFRPTLFYIDGVKDCYGIMVGGTGKPVINLYSAEIFMGQTGEGNVTGNLTEGARNGAGIYCESTGVMFTVHDLVILTSASYCPGIYATGGSLQQHSDEQGENVDANQGSELVVATGAVYDGYPAGGKMENGEWLTVVKHANKLKRIEGVKASHGVYLAEGTDMTAGGGVIVEKCRIFLYSQEASGVRLDNGSIEAKELDVAVRTGKIKLDENGKPLPFTNPEGTGPVSERVQLTAAAASIYGGSVTITGKTTVTSDSLGIIVSDGGKPENVAGGSTQPSGNSTVGFTLTSNAVFNMTSYGSTAIFINGGNAVFEAGVEATITSYPNTETVWAMGDTTRQFNNGIVVLNGSFQSAANITLNCEVITATPDVQWASPKSLTDPFPLDGNTFYDGILVRGGSFTSTGTLNVTHKGVPTWTGYNGYQNRVTRSFAIRVDGASEGTSGSGTSNVAQVVITQGTIQNSVGGGIYTNNGTLVLGTQGAENGNLTVKTTGQIVKTANGAVDDAFDPINLECEVTGENAFARADWKYRNSSMGSNALEVMGGTVTVHSGSYTSMQGNGLLVHGAERVDLLGGIFHGNDGYQVSSGTAWPAGYGASYAFKSLGGTTVINGATFQGEGSGIFASGAPDSTGVFHPATVQFLKGTVDVTGHAGVSVYTTANFTFGESTSANEDDIIVRGADAGLTVEKGPYKALAKSQSIAGFTAGVHVYGGEFRATVESWRADGVWYGNQNIPLTIKGGKFIGNGRSGMRMNIDSNNGAPDPNNLSIGGNDAKPIQFIAYEIREGRTYPVWLDSWDFKTNPAIYQYAAITRLGSGEETNAARLEMDKFINVNVSNKYIKNIDTEKMISTSGKSIGDCLGDWSNDGKDNYTPVVRIEIGHN